MDKKVVLITGASNGIGAQMARVFANNDYCVIVNYNKSKTKAENLVNEICSKGKMAISYQADVSCAKQVEDMVNYAISCFGHIDVLINNAGICSNKILIDETYESVNDVISVNVLGTIITSKIVTKHMLKTGKGKIINISSIWGVVGGAGESVYSASKGAIIAFTKSLAKELAFSNITVNAIAPGVVETNMLNCFNKQEKQNLKEEIPLKRFASTNEIANVALFLAEKKADYITGQTIQIDGGFCL